MKCERLFLLIFSIFYFLYFFSFDYATKKFECRASEVCSRAHTFVNGIEISHWKFWLNIHGNFIMIPSSGSQRMLIYSMLMLSLCYWVEIRIQFDDDRRVDEWEERKYVSNLSNCLIFHNKSLEVKLNDFMIFISLFISHFSIRMSWRCGRLWSKAETDLIISADFITSLNVTFRDAWWFH